MKQIDCSEMVIEDIVKILNDYSMCDLAVKDENTIIILGHRVYIITELKLE